MMQSGPDFSFVAALFALLLLAIGGLLTVWLVVRLLKRRKQVGFLSLVGVVGLTASLLIGGGGTLVGLVKAFGAVGGESIDPSQRAAILAEGISGAMNCTAFGLALWIPSVLIALVVERTIATNNEDRGEPPAA